MGWVQMSCARHIDFFEYDCESCFRDRAMEKVLALNAERAAHEATQAELAAWVNGKRKVTVILDSADSAELLDVVRKDRDEKQAELARLRTLVERAVGILDELGRAAHESGCNTDPEDVGADDGCTCGMSELLADLRAALRGEK